MHVHGPPPHQVTPLQVDNLATRQGRGALFAKNTPFCELWEAMGGGRASHDSHTRPWPALQQSPDHDNLQVLREGLKGH